MIFISAMEFQSPELCCSLSIEQISTSSGIAPKKAVYRTANISLGRNEFRDIVMKLELSKKTAKYTVSNFLLTSMYAYYCFCLISLIYFNIIP